MSDGLDLVGALTALAAIYVALAYLIVPALWSHYEHEPGLREFPMRTATVEGIQGDPLNVGLVGTGAELIAAMRAAGWGPADPITLRTSIAVAGSVLFHRPDPDAPVSTLTYLGRRQDLAFEKPVGTSAGRRHHVRFWQALDRGKDGRPVWLGSATFDQGVGLSRYTGQITHHIAADVDAERERLIADVSGAGFLARIYFVSGIGPTLRARNGGGDNFFTDGDIHVGVLIAERRADNAAAEVLPSPKPMVIKNDAWKRGKALLRRRGGLRA